MNNEVIKEIIDTIGTHQSILLTAHHTLDSDSAGSILALYHVLKALGKEPHPITLSKIPEELSFLPGINQFEQLSDKKEKEFVISLYNPNVIVDEVKYTTSANGLLRIIVTPKTGMFEANDMKTKNPLQEYDLIIVVDSGDQKNIGPLYQQHKDIFEKAVVINIDHHISNDNFGDINFVDTASSSACELIYKIIFTLDKNLITKDVATCLLTGIIADTGSFKHGNTTASSLKTAAELMERGADQQEIIVNLFKKRTFETLKMWGKILTRVKTDEKYGILWSSLSFEDLQKTGGEIENISNILDELLVTYPNANYFLLFTEIEKGKVKVSIRTKNEQYDGEKICTYFGGGGHKEACGFIKENTTLEKIIEEVMTYIRSEKTETIPEMKTSSEKTSMLAEKIQNFLGR